MRSTLSGEDQKALPPGKSLKAGEETNPVLRTLGWEMQWVHNNLIYRGREKGD